MSRVSAPIRFTKSWTPLKSSRPYSLGRMSSVFDGWFIMRMHGLPSEPLRVERNARSLSNRPFSTVITSPTSSTLTWLPELMVENSCP